MFNVIHMLNDQCISFPMYQNVLTEVNLYKQHMTNGGCVCRFLDSFSKLELFIIMKIVNNNALYPREYLCIYVYIINIIIYVCDNDACDIMYIDSYLIINDK